MRITAVEDLHADAGWRTLSFLKISTDAGITGWSEYNEGYGSRGLTAVIHAIGDTLVGEDPRGIERIAATLYAQTRQAPGGINAQAIAALENALLDIKGKSVGLPVHALFGGAVRDRLPVYWSHCGSRRVRSAALVGAKAPGSLDDIEALGGEVRGRGFTALKANIIRFDGTGGASVHMPGFGSGDEHPQLNARHGVAADAAAMMAAFRRGAGADADLMLDLNFNFKPEGYLKLLRALEPVGLTWAEIDLYDPAALARIRQAVTTPIASGESLFGRRAFRPFFEAGAMDVAIIDVLWNGLIESYKIAAMADAFEVNVAPHNFYGPLAMLISGHFCSMIPNFRIMEMDVDEVPWIDSFITAPARIEAGCLHLPAGPGWGAEVNEEAVRAHPPKPAARSVLMPGRKA
ncbi:MAG TPA: mandelate racemase/muconate lactonizing enzyme family protein [Roseomonas sp.]